MPFRVCSRDEEEVLRCWRREASGAGRLWVSENWILNQQTAPSTASIGFSVNAGAGGVQAKHPWLEMPLSPIS